MWQGMVGRGAHDNRGDRGAASRTRRASHPAVRPEDAAIRALIDQRHGAIRDVSRLEHPARQRRRHRLRQVLALFRRRPGVSGLGFGRRRTRDGSLIKLDRFGGSPDELTALLAHELQHANEVASDSEITDLASFQNSFASRGWKHADGFETEEAGKISKTVAAELSRREIKASPKPE